MKYHHSPQIGDQDVKMITPVLHLAQNHLAKIAIRDDNGSHTYADVLLKTIQLCKKIKEFVGESKSQERIGFICPNDVSYVITQWACWASGHIGNFYLSFSKI